MAEFESAYEWLGGDAQVRALVDRFYDLMDLEPNYQALRAAHGPTLDTARDKLYWFLSGWVAPTSTSSSLDTRACAPATCPFQSAFKSGINGWPAWPRP